MTVLVVPEEGAAIQGTLLDLSMGGIRLLLSAPIVTGGSVRIQLRAHGPAHHRASVLVTVVDIRSEEGHTVLVGSFADPSPSNLRVVAEVLFSDTEAWSHDRYAFDRPVRAFLQVILTPLTVLLGDPAWMRPLLRMEGESAALVPGVDERACARCGAPLVTGALHCERCGASLPHQDDLMEAVPVATAPRRASFRFMTAPGFMLLGGLCLAMGWQPLRGMVGPYLPSERYAKTAGLTRLAELVHAWHQLSALEHELHDAVAHGKDVPQDWSSRLWSVLKTDEIFGDITSDPEHADAEANLQAILLDLASVEKQRHDHPDAKSIDRQLDAIEQRLLETRQALQITE